MAVAFQALLGQGSISDLGTVTVGTAVPVGNFVVASCHSQQGLSGVTDSRGNTYSQLIADVGAGTNIRIFGAYITTALQVGDTLTFDFTGATTARVLVYSFSGVRQVSPVDVSANNSGTGTSWTSGTTGTTAERNSIAVSCVSVPDGRTISFDSPNTKIGQEVTPPAGTFNHAAGYQLLTHNGTQSASGTLSSSDPWVAAIFILSGNPLTGAGVVGTVGAGTNSRARVSQVAVEALEAGLGNARVSQDAVEVLEAGAGNARVSQDAIEVLRASTGVTTAGVSQVAIEVLGAVGITYSKSGWGKVGCNGYGTRRFPHEKTGHGIVNCRAFGTGIHVFFGVGPGNGGEAFCIQLAANGTSVTATLTATLTTDSPVLHLSGDGSLPATGGFCLTIDDEEIYVVRQAVGQYRILHRAMGGTQLAAHTTGTTATWDDTYDMAVRSTVDVAADFFFEDDELTYPGWIFVFDCSQAYLAGDRYPLWVDELIGVFPPGGGANKLDGSTPVVEHVPGGTTDDCPAAIGVPARIVTDISVGDVAVVRYVNPAAGTLTLCDRAAGIQSWYGFKRVDDDDVDTTLDPPGPTDHIVDGSIEDEFFDESFITVTLPGSSRTFTHGGTPSPPNFNEKGWPIAALAVRQGNYRVPHWTSPTWHNYTYVYTGFHTDAVFVHLLINRNGLVYGPLPSVTLPGPQDIDGPDATWDDASYFSSTAWGVYIFNGTYAFPGPQLNPPPGPAPPPTIVPIVGSGSAGSPPGSTPADEGLIVEGGEGGDIDPPGAVVVEEFRVIFV